MTPDQPQKILIVAGESSGDHHAAALVQAMKSKSPAWEFCGIGGDSMKAAGVSLFYHISQMAIIGIAEVARHLPFIRQVQKRLEQEMDSGITAVILVDYPGFNLRIARIAKKKKIPVIYYISPQLWAWGEKRVEKIRRDVDLLLVLFKFEVEFYRQHGIEAHFVGHPLQDHFPPAEDAGEFRRRYGVHPEKPILGLFPGSREMEVSHLLKPMIQAAALLKAKTGCEIAVSKAPHISDAIYSKAVNGAEDVRMVDAPGRQLMLHCHSALAASGTATLELGYARVPMVVLYRVAPLTYWIGRFLVKIDAIALANIVLGEKVVPEFIQGDIRPEKIAAELQRYFDDAQYYDLVRQKLAGIKDALGAPGASQRASRKIVEFLNR